MLICIRFYWVQCARMNAKKEIRPCTFGPKLCLFCFIFITFIMFLMKQVYDKLFKTRRSNFQPLTTFG